MDPKIVKATSKGQITIPKKWRDQFQTDNFLLKVEDSQIIISPVDVRTLEREDVIFDADRDNDGKGVSIDEMIRLLKDL
jgi:AbrB family looped-hinge helix DNA binding protein